MMDTGRLGRCLLIRASGFVGIRLVCTVQSNRSDDIEYVLLLR
jgi:hypothetical protein